MRASCRLAERGDAFRSGRVGAAPHGGLRLESYHLRSISPVAHGGDVRYGPILSGKPTARQGNLQAVRSRDQMRFMTHRPRVRQER